jgi:hypothetical protein
MDPPASPETDWIAPFAESVLIPVTFTGTISKDDGRKEEELP